MKTLIFCSFLLFFSINASAKAEKAFMFFGTFNNLVCSDGKEVDFDGSVNFSIEKDKITLVYDSTNTPVAYDLQVIQEDKLYSIQDRVSDRELIISLDKDNSFMVMPNYKECSGLTAIMSYKEKAQP